MIKKLFDMILAREISWLLKLGILCTLFGLFLDVLPLWWPHPLVVIASMSVGQPVGIVGILLYGFAVVAEVRRGRSEGQSSGK